mmetsp:Transcript_17774/g.56663  ORF Transcript_17774/g.56663 Transcript_17774/m.56663 type:complete len:93 (+) Transcript_17774:68-346(+)
MHFLNASGGVRFLLVPYFGYTQLTPATVAVALLVVALLLVWLRAVAIGGRRTRGCAAASPLILALHAPALCDRQAPPYSSADRAALPGILLV